MFTNKTTVIIRLFFRVKQNQNHEHTNAMYSYLSNTHTKNRRHLVAFYRSSDNFRRSLVNCECYCEWASKAHFNSMAKHPYKHENSYSKWKHSFNIHFTSINQQRNEWHNIKWDAFHLHWNIRLSVKYFASLVLIFSILN